MKGREEPYLEALLVPLVLFLWGVFMTRAMGLSEAGEAPSLKGCRGRSEYRFNV